MAWRAQGLATSVHLPNAGDERSLARFSEVKSTRSPRTLPSGGWAASLRVGSRTDDELQPIREVETAGLASKELGVHSLSDLQQAGVRIAPRPSRGEGVHVDGDTAAAVVEAKRAPSRLKQGRSPQGSRHAQSRGAEGQGGLPREAIDHEAKALVGDAGSLEGKPGVRASARALPKKCTEPPTSWTTGDSVQKAPSAALWTDRLKSSGWVGDTLMNHEPRTPQAQRRSTHRTCS